MVFPKKGTASRIDERGERDMMTPVNGKKEVVGAPKPIDPVKTANSVVTPKVVLSISTDEKGKDVPQDQVGQCDNLTASYWG